MNTRAVAFCLLAALSPMAMAGQPAPRAASPADPAVARATLQSLRGQEKQEDAQVQQLKTRVDTLESDSRAAGQALEERDRKIAELQRQLDAAQGR